MAWYTVGIHHLLPEEDEPVMPVMWHHLVIGHFSFSREVPWLTCQTGAVQR
jgi:Cu2+-containing amine oxidase